MSFPVKMQHLPLDAETYSPWSNIYSVGLRLAASCAQAGFLDWASNLAQLRDPKAQERRTTKRQRPRPRAPRRSPTYVRRLFVWGFIGTNVAISIAWARAADEAAGTTGLTRESAALLRAPGGMFYMAENLTLTARSLRDGRWWTLLTNVVSHANPAHLIINMGAFYTWASRCFDLGLGPGSVAGLMLGSTVCCGVVSLASEPAWRSSMHMGAGGLVSGLTARLVDSKIMAGVAVILLEPVMRFRVPDVCDFRWPVFATVLMGFAADIIGVLSQRRALTAPSMAHGSFHSAPKSLVGYAGNLGGAVFGVASWYFWLRSRFGTW